MSYEKWNTQGFVAKQKVGNRERLILAYEGVVSHCEAWVTLGFYCLPEDKSKLRYPWMYTFDEIVGKAHECSIFRLINEANQIGCIITSAHLEEEKKSIDRMEHFRILLNHHDIAELCDLKCTMFNEAETDRRWKRWFELAERLGAEKIRRRADAGRRAYAFNERYADTV